jgi:pyruvate dehydrogenase E1 component alpha subunit
MNFRHVRDTLSEVVDSIRKDPHPAFVEARTYRYRGHSMSDPASYRTKEQLEKYRLDDPITRLRAQLTREGKLTNEKFDELDRAAKQTALEAVKFAEESEEPPLEKLYDYTYVDGAIKAVVPAAPKPGKGGSLANSENASETRSTGSKPAEAAAAK